VKSSLLALLGLWLASAAHAQTIVLDQAFSDWDAVPVAGANPANDHLKLVQAASNAGWAFFRVTLGEELALDESIVPHALELWVDVDGNPNTGHNAPSQGWELEIDFVQGEVRRYNANGVLTTLGFNDVGLHQSPTYSADDVELALSRADVNMAGAAVRWQWFDGLHGQYLPSEPATTELSNAASDHVPVPLERGPGTALRCMWWNMNGRMDQSGPQAAMGRMVAAVAPDVIGFCEVSDVTAGEVKGLLESWLPGSTWNVVKDDYDLMVASTLELGQGYPGVYRSFPVVVETGPVLGLPTLFASSHLKCCGGPDNEAQRQSEADEYMAFQRDAMTPGGQLDLPNGAPIVFGGDLNMVGLSGPIRTLVTGDIYDNAAFGPDFAPDWDGTAMTELPVVQADRPMDYTWRNDNSDYMPGKLDYAIVSDGVVGVVRMFGLQTSDMDAARLANYNLQAGDTWTASDHMPVVVDLAWGGDASEDLDEDGVPDGLDNCPEVPNPAQADFNGNGMGDACEDSDNDGLWDAEELNWGTDPLVQDTDGDGLTDSVEIYLYNSDPLSSDTDGDGVSDSIELLFPPTSGCPGDLNNDQSVTIADLLLLLSSIGQVC